MKIICTENEKEWLENPMVESDSCVFACHCKSDTPADMKTICKRCIEENVEFEIEK